MAEEFLTGGEKLYCWEEREAEIEFLLEKKGKVIPVEVKSGGVTKAKSLQSFRNKYHSLLAIILSGKPLDIDSSTHFYPLYMAGILNQL